MERNVPTQDQQIAGADRVDVFTGRREGRRQIDAQFRQPILGRRLLQWFQHVGDANRPDNLLQSFQ